MKTFITDLIKGLVLGGIIGLPIIYALMKFVTLMPQNWWIVGWAFLMLVQIILLFAYPRFIAPLFNKFSPMEEGETKEKVLELLKRTGFSSNGLFVMDASRRSSHGNAYFTGFGKNKRIVFFDTLLKSLNPVEVEAVLAHELGHFKKKHVLKMIIKSFIFSLVGFFILGQLINSQVFFNGHGIQEPTIAKAFLLFSMVASLYTYFLTPISSYFSRKHEFEADTFASENANAEDLISALIKLYKENSSTLTPDPLYSSFYHSHPPALTRVQFLESLKNLKKKK